MYNFNMIEKLRQNRLKFESNGQKISEGNWQSLESICSDRAVSARCRLKIEYFSDWKELVSGLIKEISYIRDQGNNMRHQYLVQNEEISILKGIDVSKEALILFGDGAEEIYLYQPNKSEISKEIIRESVPKLLMEKGVSIGNAIKNCCFDQGKLIGRLAKELQEMEKEYQDKIGLFYSLIQDSKVSKLSDFQPDREALVLVGNKFVVQIYLYQP